MMNLGNYVVVQMLNGEVEPSTFMIPLQKLEIQKMVKFSLYMDELELELLEEARTKLIKATGLHISRNGYIRSLLFSSVNNEVENGLSVPTNRLQTEISP